jgi:TolA-binding protein
MPPASAAGPEEAIELYDRILAAYPDYALNDQVLYQKSRAYDELGRTEEAMQVMERLVAEYPGSRHIDEVHFRRAEHFFVRRKYLDAEEAYLAIAARGPSSEYYELALYKLGWTFYKQELHEEALDRYVALLDHKVSVGYDFEQPQDEDEERRVADTYRVISLCFSNLGGPEVVEQYFETHGQRTYENHVYARLGDFYLEKLRYNDAAATHGAFVELYPLHRSSPHFGMRIIEIYEAGGFPKLVLESKKQFAASYGLKSEYWSYFDVEEAPEVLRYLQSNLEALAGHYHAAYQEGEAAGDQSENFDEARRWYRAYLESFPGEESTPPIHYRLADLLLEHGDFAEAAREYERTAYDYAVHERASAAGYAAIYAHREHLKRAISTARETTRREAVRSTLRFADTFPDHEHAAAVLGAAADDLYVMKDFEQALATARRLIATYPEADVAILRSAWAVVAHASLDIADYPEAERAYARVLEITPADEDSRQDVVDNLAAAIYQQAEQANAAEDFRSAADHFLRIAQVAPTSDVRPLAEYDAGAALVRLEDWSGAAKVFESFREAYPQHELQQQATEQVAFIYRREGNASRAGAEYERVALEAEDSEMRREALLVAAELYESAGLGDRALAVYQAYVTEFEDPIETAVETRFKLAEMLKDAGNEGSYRDHLRRIVEIDGAAGNERTERVRYLAALSALVLSEDLYQAFEEVPLVQPLERNLQEKQRRMDAALEGFGELVDYEVAQVTAAATFYIAEIYNDFSRELVASARPSGLDADQLSEYETALESEAFPFEEKAIEIHEKNMELIATGIYNAWVDRSLAKLADLVPGRYAKFEASSGLIASIDRYAYELPGPDEIEPLEFEPSTPASAADEIELPQEMQLDEPLPPADPPSETEPSNAEPQ